MFIIVPESVMQIIADIRLQFSLADNLLFLMPYIVAVRVQLLGTAEARWEKKSDDSGITYRCNEEYINCFLCFHNSGGNGRWCQSQQRYIGAWCSYLILHAFCFSVARHQSLRSRASQGALGGQTWKKHHALPWKRSLH